jgi:uncharacterized repeat protein (TIGR03987 family)
MLLPIAIFSMISALVMYTSGVWGEKLAGILKNRHLIFFWIGFVFDMVGTTIMAQMAGGFTSNLHGITGAVAIVLMLIHVVWATLALGFRQERVLRNFHRYSLAVWGIWLIPFVSGMIMGKMG